MTKKDYILLAEALKSSKPENLGSFSMKSAEIVQWETTLKVLTKALQQDNPRFNEKTFLEACGCK
jgi:hypothetical protein